MDLAAKLHKEIRDHVRRAYRVDDGMNDLVVTGVLSALAWACRDMLDPEYIEAADLIAGYCCKCTGVDNYPHSEKAEQLLKEARKVIERTKGAKGGSRGA